jgi:hypothetical protein
MPNINNKLIEEIKLYCKINNIVDSDKFLNDLIRDAFSVIKYGNKPDIEINPEGDKVSTDTEQPIPSEEDKIIIKNKKIENDKYGDIYDI